MLLEMNNYEPIINFMLTIGNNIDTWGDMGPIIHD